MTGTPRTSEVAILIRDAHGECKVYALLEVDVPPDCRAWRLRRNAGPKRTKTYTVQRDRAGRITCDCRGFVYGGECKHADAMLARGMMALISKSDREAMQRQRDKHKATA